MSSNPLVSIIIPTYNREHLISDTLESILKQTYPYWECLIVDDGSTDNTEALVTKFSECDDRFKFYNRPDTHSPGGNGARNFGFLKCKGDLVQWFDDDDVMGVNYLSDRIKVFRSQIQLVICSGYHVDENLKNPEPVELKITTSLYKDYYLWRTNIFTPSILFRRQFLDGKDLFNTKILRGQETEFYSRIFYKLKASEYEILNKELFYYRSHENSKSVLLKKAYNSQVCFSRLFIAFENLKRGIALKDEDIIEFSIKTILIFYKLVTKNRDLENFKFIKNSFNKNALKLKATFLLNLYYYVPKVKIFHLLKVSLLKSFVN